MYMSRPHFITLSIQNAIYAHEIQFAAILAGLLARAAALDSLPGCIIESCKTQNHRISILERGTLKKQLINKQCWS